MKMAKYWEENIKAFELETGEDLFDGLSEGDLSPVEKERMCSTSVGSTLWEESV